MAKDKRVKKAIARRTKKAEKVEKAKVAAAWRNIFVKSGVLKNN